MLRSILPVLALFAAAGLAIGEPPTTPTTTQPAKITKPSKSTEPSKEAKEITLKVGSKAPGIKAEKWLKGSEVKSFESGKVYVVEFWATWCPPCRDSIPHLTELQKKHKDVTVIGMASSEKKSGETDMRLEKLEKFVKDQGDKMSYTIAYDATRAMARDWLQAAGRSGIPCAFVVDGKGTVTFIGNPLSQHEELVSAVEKAQKSAGTKSAAHG